MPRSLWSGSISFGLVNVPARIYPAVREHKLHFHYVHAPDSSPIGYQKICKAEDKPVPDDEVVKAFEVADGEFVYVDDEDFEQARGAQLKTIDILDFVPRDEIDPLYFAKTYYLGPVEGSEHVYALFLRALDESGLVAVAKFVLRDRQHLAALRVHGKVIALEQLYFGDEILATNEIETSGQRVAKDELELARRLIEANATTWKPDRYEDTYEVELRAAIEAKRKGEGVHEAPAEETEEEVPDLMAALRASVEQSSKKRRRRRAAA